LAGWKERYAVTEDEAMGDKKPLKVAWQEWCLNGHGSPDTGVSILDRGRVSLPSQPSVRI